ncbi:putative transcription factor p65 homolog isoform X2 [Ptychodera flava]|uniref:putative transcription factor p65 homolog isoform X2 n=1 Tax=Ptychodera flava TaxID=63121 RepID=UPI00396A3955
MTESTEGDGGQRFNSIERILESMAVNQMDWNAVQTQLMDPQIHPQLFMNGNDSDLPEDLQGLDILSAATGRSEVRPAAEEERILEIQQQLLQIQDPQQQHNLAEQQQLHQQQQQQLHHEQYKQQQKIQQKKHRQTAPIQQPVPVTMSEGGPYTEIIEQCKSRGQRFRYVCEGRSAGSLAGENSTQEKKTYPTIKIQNYRGEAMVVVSLVTKEDPPKPHPHSLVGKGCTKGICSMKVSPETDMKACFQNLGIQCVRKKDIQESLQKRKELRVDPFGTFHNGQTLSVDDFELNVVRLCFQVFLPENDPQGSNNQPKFTVPLAPVTSEPIYDKKGATLHISRVDKHAGSAHGGDEIFILCDKIQKEDIEVIFKDIEGEWEAKGQFGQNDVHRQVAIVVKTPPYVDPNITEPITIHMLLRRPSDGETSEPFDFRYKPSDNDMQIIEGKRKRKRVHFDQYVTPSDQKHVKSESLQASCFATGDQDSEKKLAPKELLRRKLKSIKHEGPQASCDGGARTKDAMLPSSVPVSSSSSLSFSSVSHTSFGHTIVSQLPQTTSSTSATTTYPQPSATVTAEQYQGMGAAAASAMPDLDMAGLGVHTGSQAHLFQQQQQQQQINDVRTITGAAMTTTGAELGDVMANTLYDQQQDVMFESLTDSMNLPFGESTELPLDGSTLMSTVNITDLNLAAEDYQQ